MRNHVSSVPFRPRTRFRIRALLVMLVEGETVRCTRTADEEATEERSVLPTLVMPRQGVFRYHDDRQTALADANTLLLFHPNQPYRISHPSDCGDECVALRFDPDALADALESAGGAARIWILDAASQRVVHQFAADVLTRRDTLGREERAFDLLTALRGAGGVLTRWRDDARIDAVREHLAADVAANISLAELARQAGFSPFHLARRFRAHTGTSLHQYRLALRLNDAGSMLRDGADDLTTLALDLGFASLAHFSAAFRTAYGICPSAARGRRPDRR